MPEWDEASVDDLLADPIVRDLMAADGVEPGELRALLARSIATLQSKADPPPWPALWSFSARSQMRTPPGQCFRSVLPGPTFGNPQSRLRTIHDHRTRRLAARSLAQRDALPGVEP